MPIADSIHFVFKERDIDRVNRRLAQWAFTPTIKERGRLVLSTCEDRHLSDSDAWEMGGRLQAMRDGFRLAKRPEAPAIQLLGRADMKAAHYGDRGLDFESKALPTLQEHVNVVGWEQVAPTGEQREQLALIISMDSMFIPAP